MRGDRCLFVIIIIIIIIINITIVIFFNAPTEFPCCLRSYIVYESAVLKEDYADLLIAVRDRVNEQVAPLSLLSLSLYLSVSVFFRYAHSIILTPFVARRTLPFAPWRSRSSELSSASPG